MSRYIDAGDDAEPAERRGEKSKFARGRREFALLAASFSGLGIVPCIYVTTHFPRFADYPLIATLSYLGIAVEVICLWLFYRTHHDLGDNWSVSLDLRERHTLVTTGVYSLVRHP